MADFSPTKPWTINHGRCPPRTGHGCVGCCGLRSPGARKGGGGCTALGGGRSWRGHPPRASVPVHLSAAPLIPEAKPDLHLAPCTILHGKFVLVGFKQHRVTGAKGLDDIELSRKGAPCPQRAIVRVVPKEHARVTLGLHLGRKAVVLCVIVCVGGGRAHVSCCSGYKRGGARRDRRNPKRNVTPAHNS